MAPGLCTRKARRPAAATVVAAALALALGGCGDLSRDELARGVSSLRATAAEGRLLASEIARDRTRKTFARVHAKELSDNAEHEQEKLTDSRSAARIDPQRRKAIALAGRISSQLGDLSVNAGDEATGRSVAAALSAAETDADHIFRALARIKSRSAG